MEEIKYHLYLQQGPEGGSNELQALSLTSIPMKMIEKIVLENIFRHR